MNEKKRKPGLMQRLEAVGHYFFYLMMRIFGHSGGRLLLYPVVLVYVIFNRKIRRIVGYYLIRRFPGEYKLKYYLYTLKIVLSFGNVLVDRGWLGVCSTAKFKGELIGYSTLRNLIDKGKGAVLITAHVGNWQSALAQLGDLPVQVHALMRYDQEVAAKHFFDLGKKVRPFEIIDVDSPYGGMLEAGVALQRGEVVTVMGDRYTKGPCCEVEFLGGTVRLPSAAYILAATAGAPVIVLLAAKTAPKRYNLKVWDWYYPEYRSRDKRQEMLIECSGRFIGAVEAYLEVYPFQWYNFYNFWDQ